MAKIFKKYTLKQGYLVAGLIVLAGVLFLATKGFGLSNSTVLPQNYYPAKKGLLRIPQGPTVRVGRAEINVEIAKTNAEIQKGLSGRKYLDQNHGMLFIFSKPDFYRFWMPDMNFPIDIIWIADGKIIGMEEKISNYFNPAQPKFYTPPQPVQHVLEVNAGFAKNKNIRIGDPIILNYIE